MTAERRRAWPRLLRGVLLAMLVVAAGLAVAWLTLPDPSGYARANPTTTALIEQRRAEARAAGRPFQPAMTWVPLDRISPRLAGAVVASEDARFFAHRGFEWEALRDAVRHNLARGRYARGASTISQQLCKNLWLGTEKSLLRKAREALLTVKLERRLDKRRILALYLNAVEWGSGVFGAEAGARRHFGTGAGSLSQAQAVLLASMLPAPRRAALSPAPAWLAARSRFLLERLRDEQAISPAEYAAARVELEGYLGPVPVAGPGEPPAEPPPDDPAPADAAEAPPPREEADPAPAPPPREEADPAPAPTPGEAAPGTPAESPAEAPVPDPGAFPPPSPAPVGAGPGPAEGEPPPTRAAP